MVTLFPKAMRLAYMLFDKEEISFTVSGPEPTPYIKGLSFDSSVSFKVPAFSRTIFPLKLVYKYANVDGLLERVFDLEECVAAFIAVMIEERKTQ